MNVRQAEHVQAQWAALEVAMTRAMMTASDIQDGSNDRAQLDAMIDDALTAWADLVTLGVTEQVGHLVRQYVRLARANEEDAA